MMVKQASISLHNSRFVPVKCAVCFQFYNIDLGGEDRFEYIRNVAARKTTCPLCGVNMQISKDTTLLDCVLN